VLKNNSDGTFAAQVTYAVGRFPYSVISTDIDRDGDADLITANYSTNTISVLRNNGNGNFSAKVDYAIAGFPTSITAADIDGDRQMDLITANNSSNTISVLRNMGNGTFVTHAAYAVGSNPSAVTSADMDGDGFIDLITAITGTSSSPGNTISVLRNNGYGAFDGEALYSVGSSPRSVTSADVDGDGPDHSKQFQ
jgi:6-phosphogluconolactonase (cycloisomerase 2 family)